MERRIEGAGVMVAGSVGEAMKIVASDQRKRVVVFERSWRAVDRSRQEAERLGAGCRLSVHHDSARAFFGGYWNAA